MRKINWKSKYNNYIFGLAILLTSFVGLRKYYMDEITLSGTRISKINTGTLTNGDTSVPTSLTVFNAILAQASPSNSGLSGWIDITDSAYGGVPDGSYTSGTDNSIAINKALAAAVNNNVIYIRPGKFRCLSTINWPTNKRVFLVSYGDLFFGSNSGIIIDGNTSYFMFYGSLFGSDQFSIPNTNYTGLTNSGIYVRNGRNNVIAATTISGFKYAIRMGGFATGTSLVQGSQYNKISWEYLQRNSIGVYLAPSGGTTNSRGNWCNENQFWGGEITGDSGVVYAKDATQGDRFNGNKFHDIGFEGAGNGVPMACAIKGEFALNEEWYGGRFEPAAVVTKLSLASTCDNFTFIGWYWEDSWLANPGNAIHITGSIYNTTQGVCIGNTADGYIFNSVTTTKNGRVLVHGGLRSPSIAGSTTVTSKLAANIDVEFTAGVAETATGSTYTPSRGIRFGQINYAAGTNTTTLPSPTLFSGEWITLKNLQSTNTVTVVGAATGSITSIPGYGAITYYSDGNNWYDWSSRIIYTGGGGSSQWTTSGSYIYYNNNIMVGGTTPNQYSWFQLGASSSTKALMEFAAAGGYVTSPRNNSIDYDGLMLRLTNNVGVPQYVTTNYNTQTLVNKTWQGVAISPFYIDGSVGSPASGSVLVSDGTVNGSTWDLQNYKMLYANNASVTITGTSVGSLLSGVGDLTPINKRGKYRFKASGYLTTTSGSQTLQLIFKPGGGVGVIFTQPVTVPGGLTLQPWDMEFEVTAIGVAYSYEIKFTLINAGAPSVTQSNSRSNTGWTVGGSDINTQIQWVGTGNTFYTYNANWELYRL